MATARNTDHPRISVGLPVYNGANYVGEAIEAILAQTVDDLELVISDNASTDETPEICARYAREDRRVRVFRSDRNLGAAANYNRVFRLARGRFFKWAAHDDLIAPTFLERCLEVLETEPDVVVCFPESIILSADGTPIERLAENPGLRFEEDLDLRMERPHQRLRHLVHELSMCHAVFGLMRRDALSATRLIDRFHSSDVVLLTELALQGRFWRVPEPLFMRRLHPGISMWNKTPEQVAEWFDPEAPPRVVLRYNRLFVEQLRSIGRSRVTASEKLRCVAVMLIHELRRKRRVIITEWGNALRRVIAGSEQPTVVVPTTAPPSPADPVEQAEASPCEPIEPAKTVSTRA